MPGNSQVINDRVEDATFQFGPFGLFEGEFTGHLNTKAGDQPHVVGQGTLDVSVFGQELFSGVRANFVETDNVTNVVLHTDEGVVHFNDHSGFTGPGETPVLPFVSETLV